MEVIMQFRSFISASAVLLAFASVNMASAQTVIGFPAAVSTAKPAAASTKVRARCVFSAQRPLAMLLQSTLIQEYQKLGYSRVNASVRISTPTTAITELQLPNISGISKLAPKPGAHCRSM